jgi:hypothetical protein
VRSPLDTLEQLRQRAHDTEQSRLARHAEAERIAEAEQERARQTLHEATLRHEAARRAEDERLVQQGITAAEGQRRVAWEKLQRKARAQLWDVHERAVDKYRSAATELERARQALTQADAELRQVRQRIDKRERTRLEGEERAQQEIADESSTRRFLERNGA